MFQPGRCTPCFIRVTHELSGQFTYRNDKVSSVLELFLVYKEVYIDTGTSLGEKWDHVSEEIENS